MKKNKEESISLNDEEMEILIQEADTEAAADMLTQVDEPEDEPVDEEEAIQRATADKDRFVVLLEKEYEWNKEKITQLDLSGVQNLTTSDLEYVDRVLELMRRNPKNKYMDTTYQKHIAMRITGLPAEFFNKLKLRDMLTIVAVLYNYFLFG